jgi:uncharacterized membrane protein YccC
MGIGAVLFAKEPGPLGLIIIIVLCQAVAELFMARSYGVALLFITPVAIGMSNLGRNLPWSPPLLEHLVEAGLGAVIALAAIMVGNPRESRRTAHRQRGVERALGRF